MIDVLYRIMFTIVLNIWLFQLIMYYKEGADKDYEASLMRPKYEKIIKEVVDNVKGDILE